LHAVTDAITLSNGLQTRPLLARHEPVVSGSHFDESFGRLRMSLLVRMEPYRKDPKPGANGLSRMSQMRLKPQAAQSTRFPREDRSDQALGGKRVSVPKHGASRTLGG
jgi:hypothetical protein